MEEQIPVKRGRGRPRKDPNQPVKTPVAPHHTECHVTAAPSGEIVGVTQIAKKPKAPKVPLDPEWVLTKTYNGTSIAITGIIKGSNYHEFFVVPRAEDGNTSQTVVKSEEVVRPIFDNPEKEKEFEGVQFWIPPVVPVQETPPV